MLRLRRLLAPVVVLAVCAAVPATASACTNPATTSAVSRLVSYSAGGGIAGMFQSANISTSGRVVRTRMPVIVCGSPLNYTLTHKQLTTLKALIKAAKLKTLKTTYYNPNVSDSVTETVKVPGVHSVSVSTLAAGVPARLTRLLTYLGKLSDR